MSEGAQDRRARLRALPAVDAVLGALGDHPRPLATEAARRAVELARTRVLSGEKTPSREAVVAEARRLLEEHDRSLLGPVINTTGVLIHTNLGRAPLGEPQLEAVVRVARGYSNLEYDLVRGARGSRYSHARHLLARVTGSESALVTNNNAAAVLLALAALCPGREVVISRGELIEIGGEFRIPEVMAVSGATLVEVGTTNRTHLRDYERALGPDTGAILKVHPSNYRVVGFTSSVRGRDLARLARDRGVVFLHDVGSGLLSSVDAPAELTAEPRADVALADGADLVTFSGDKLLGGPQAGVVVGRAELVERLARHPLARAVRPDKMTLAALEATAALYLQDRARELPLWKLTLTRLEDLERRARGLAAELAADLSGVEADAVASRAVTGGGSLPGAELGSWAVALSHESRSASALERALRAAPIPVVARIEDGRLLLDLRSVPAEQDALLLSAVVAALS